MQLSAANLIIASQQIARGAAKPAGDGVQFAQALAKEQGVKEAFEALDFKQAPAPAKSVAAAPAQASAAGYGAAQALGGNLNIIV